MNTKGIKFLAVLAVLAMAFAAFAIADSSNESVADGEEASVTINGTTTNYATVAAAVTAAQPAESGNVATIKILKDVTLNAAASFVKAGEYTLDTNGKKITVSSSAVYGFTVGGTNPPVYPIDTINTSAKLTIIGNGVIESNKTVFRSYGTMVIGNNEGGPSVTISNTAPEYSIFKVEEGSFLTVNAGTFNVSSDPSNAVTRVMQSYGTTVINGGNFGADVQLWKYGDSSKQYISTIAINGGTFTGKIMIAGVSGSGVLAATDKITINGGIFTNSTGGSLVGGTMEIASDAIFGIKAGGTFTVSGNSTLLNNGTIINNGAILVNSKDAKITSGAMGTIETSTVNGFRIDSGLVEKQTIKAFGTNLKDTSNRFIQIGPQEAGGPQYATFQNNIVDLNENKLGAYVYAGHAYDVKVLNNTFIGSSNKVSSALLVVPWQNSSFQITSAETVATISGNDFSALKMDGNKTALAFTKGSVFESGVSKVTIGTAADTNVYNIELGAKENELTFRSDIYTIASNLDVKKIDVHDAGIPLTIATGVKLTNNGTIINNGSITCEGTASIAGEGVLKNYGTLKSGETSGHNQTILCTVEVYTSSIWYDANNVKYAATDGAVIKIDATGTTAKKVLDFKQVMGASAIQSATFNIFGNVYVENGAWLDNGYADTITVKDGGVIQLDVAAKVGVGDVMTFEEGSKIVPKTTAVGSQEKLTIDGTVNYAEAAQFYVNSEITNTESVKGKVNVIGDDETKEEKTVIDDNIPTGKIDADTFNKEGNIGADVIVTTASISEAKVPAGKTVVINTAPAADAVLDVSAENSEIAVNSTVSNATFTVKAGDNVVTMKDVKGSFTFTKGSIIVKTEWEGGIIYLNNGDELKISGNVTTAASSILMSTDAPAGSSAKVIIESGADKKLTVTGVTLTIGAGISLEIEGTLDGTGTVIANEKTVMKGKLTVANFTAVKDINIYGEVGTTTITNAASKVIAYAKSNINKATITNPAKLEGKDAEGGSWTTTVSGGNVTEIKFDNYVGNYNFEKIGSTNNLAKIIVTGTNKVTYNAPATGYTGGVLFGGTGLTDIKTIQGNGSLEIVANLSKAAGSELVNQITVVKGGTLEVNGVDLKVTVEGSGAEWTVADTSAMKAKGVDVSTFTAFDAEVAIDVMSLYEIDPAKYAGAVATGINSTGLITFTSSDVSVITAGTAVIGEGLTVSDSKLTIDAKLVGVKNSTIPINMTGSLVSISGDVGIEAGAVLVNITSCLSVNISGSEFSIVGTAGADPTATGNVTIKTSLVGFVGDAFVPTMTISNSATVSVSTELIATAVVLSQASTLEVQDLYLTGAGSSNNGTIIVNGEAVIAKGAVLTNDAVITNNGTFGVYGTFTNNATFSNAGNFLVYAKAADVLSDSNKTIGISVTDNATVEGKLKVKTITVEKAYMNADGTMGIVATIKFVDNLGNEINSKTQFKAGEEKFVGTLTLTDLVKSTKPYYTLELSNGTATVKVTFKELSTGDDSRTGKSYSFDVAGKVTVAGVPGVTPDVDYDLEPNAAEKTVDDKVKALATGSTANFATGADSAITDVGTAVIYASATTELKGTYDGALATYLATNKISAAFKGNLTTTGAVEVNATFDGNIEATGAVQVNDKKTMTGNIISEGAVTITGKLKGDVSAEDSIVINGTVEGDVEVTVGTTAKTVTVGGKIDGNLIFNSKYLAKSTDKEGEETIETNIMAIDADMSTSTKTFIINLGAAKNATTSAAGEGGVFSFGTLNAPVATKAVKLTLTQGELDVTSSVTLPERFEVVIEKDTTIEVSKTATLDVKAAALKVSKDANANFETGSGVPVTYGKVVYIMTFDIEGGAYTIFSDVTYALSSCDEGAELTLGSAAEINANVSVKKGVSIIVDGVKLDFKTFGLEMDEGAKIVLKGAGNLAFGITDKIVDDPDKENEYFTISGTIVYDDENVVVLKGVRFTAASTFAGKEATTTELSKINMTLSYNQGVVSVADGNATGTITLSNDAYKLLKEDKTNTLVFGALSVAEGAVFDAVAINDKFAEVTYKDSTTTPGEYVVDETKLMPTIVTVNGTLNLSASTTVKGVYVGEGKVVLTSGKTLTLAASDAKATGAPKKVSPSIAAILVDNTADENGYYLNLVSPVAAKTLEFTSKKIKDVNVMTIKGDFYFGEIAAIDGTDAYLDKVNIEDNAAIKADVVYIIDDSKAQGGLAAKIVYMKNGTTTSEYKTLTYEVTFPEEDYTVYTFFKNVDFDLISDITIDGNKDNYTLKELVPGATKVDLSGNDVSITVAEGKTLTIDVPLIIGTPIDDLGDEGSALVGKFIIDKPAAAQPRVYIIAYSDVDMSEAEIYQDDGKTAAVYSMLDIDDIPYAAIFANEDDVVLADVDKKIVPEIEGYTFAMWVNYNLGATFVGETNAYADFKAVLVTIIVKYVAGVDYYMDGLLFQVFDTPTDVKYGSYFTAKISDTSKYQGNPMINGVKTYTVEGPDTLVATGVEPIPEPPAPEPVVGDSGLSLTDILLIVLVILIAIMVVILVLRLNRS